MGEWLGVEVASATFSSSLHVLGSGQEQGEVVLGGCQVGTAGSGGEARLEGPSWQREKEKGGEGKRELGLELGLVSGRLGLGFLLGMG